MKAYRDNIGTADPIHYKSHLWNNSKNRGSRIILLSIMRSLISLNIHIVYSEFISQIYIVYKYVLYTNIYCIQIFNLYFIQICIVYKYVCYKLSIEIFDVSDSQQCYIKLTMMMNGARKRGLPSGPTLKIAFLCFLDTC